MYNIREQEKIVECSKIETAIGRARKYLEKKVIINGKWEIPTLKYLALGGIKPGFLTVSIIQSKEAIDKYFQLNEQLNTL